MGDMALLSQLMKQQHVGAASSSPQVWRSDAKKCIIQSIYDQFTRSTLILEFWVVLAEMVAKIEAAQRAQFGAHERN